jgi:hypothetical protein
MKKKDGSVAAMRIVAPVASEVKNNNFLFRQNCVEIKLLPFYQQVAMGCHKKR